MTLAPLSEPWSFCRNQFTRCDQPTSLCNQAQQECSATNIPAKSKDPLSVRAATSPKGNSRLAGPRSPALRERSTSVESRSHSRHHHPLLRQLQDKPSALQLLPIAIRIGLGPQTSDIDRSGGLRLLHHLGGRAPLLLHVSLDHLRRQARRQLSVLSAFEQDCHKYVGIAAG